MTTLEFVLSPFGVAIIIAGLVVVVFLIVFFVIAFYRPMRRRFFEGGWTATKSRRGVTI